MHNKKGIICVDRKGAVKVYKALGEPTRLQIIEVLERHRELTCAQMGERLHVTAGSTLTHHLKPLLDCGLIAVRKEGTYRYYHLQRDVLDQYAPVLLQHEVTENVVKRMEEDKRQSLT